MIYILEVIKEYIWYVKTYRLLALGYAKWWVRKRIKKIYEFTKWYLSRS